MHILVRYMCICRNLMRSCLINAHCQHERIIVDVATLFSGRLIVQYPVHVCMYIICIYIMHCRRFCMYGMDFGSWRRIPSYCAT